MVQSGSCSGVGEKSEGMLRPRGPSGEDCNERVAGLAVDDVPLGVAAETGATMNGTELLEYCLHVVCVDGVGDGQHLLPSVIFGDGDVAVGAILYYLERIFYWFASSLRGGRGAQFFSCGFETFRRVVWRRFKYAVDDGGV